MTTQGLFKRRVRERMSRTGERYAAARLHVAAERDRVETEKARLASAMELASNAKVLEATGQGWAEWLAILDRWGARNRKHPEVVEFLMQGHGVPGWYAQTITNGYERARGIRAKHQQPNGFTIYASRTFPVPVERLFEAFTDGTLRPRWLTDGSMSVRSSQPGKVARFDWGNGAARVLVTFDSRSPAKATAHVAHERLPDADAADREKRLWKLRLASLSAVLESSSPPA